MVRADSARGKTAPDAGPRPTVRYGVKFTDCIPKELRDRAQWVVWKYRKKNGKWTKVPFQARDPAAAASTTDPTTWATFDEAWAAYLEWRGHDGWRRVDGIGFVFSP